MNHQPDKDSHDRMMNEKVLLVAEFYYSYKLSQQEIATRMGISRPWVSKLLKRAEEMGIVKIEVLTPSAGVVKLEEEIKKKYNLTSAKVVKQFSETDMLKNVGKAAANYLLTILQPRDVIGVSWGRALAAMADELTGLYYPEVAVVPIIGGLGIKPDLLSNQIAAKIASVLGAQSFLLHAPAFTIGKAERDALLQDPFINNIIEKCENVSIALTGIGALRGSTMHKAGFISDNSIQELENLGAVGDIALRFIDADGKIVSHPIHDNLVTSNLYVMRKRARQMIGVAAGTHKVPVIRAALKGKWLDSLITDYETANELLKYE